jgi:hypothetical protein
VLFHFLCLESQNTPLKVYFAFTFYNWHVISYVRWHFFLIWTLTTRVIEKSHFPEASRDTCTKDIIYIHISQIIISSHAITEFSPTRQFSIRLNNNLFLSAFVCNLFLIKFSFILNSLINLFTRALSSRLITCDGPEYLERVLSLDMRKSQINHCY